jgi:hypothetical protein
MAGVAGAQSPRVPPVSNEIAPTIHRQKSLCSSGTGISIVTAKAGEATEEPGKRPMAEEEAMIRKLKSGQYRLYSRKKDTKTGRRKNLGTFSTRDAAEQHEREVQYFKRH